MARKNHRVQSLAIGTQFLRDGIFPAAFYLAYFTAITYPLLMSFSSSFFTDNSDGFQSVWDIWWVNHAVLNLQSPWYTSYLHYPYGISLLPQTMNPFNGFIGVALLRFFTLVQTINFIVVFAFVAGGLNAFLLCKYVSGAYWPSLVGGAIFTFSNYHFAHAQGHLQVVSLEWIPLFVLLWLRLLDRPSVKIAIAAGFALFLVLLCDYYYFLYCVISGALMAAWLFVEYRGSLRSVIREHARSLAVFVLTVVVTCGPLIVGLLLLNARDPLIGAHNESEFSLDLPALVIPGGHWRFAQLTKFYWDRLPGNINESSVHLGLSVVLLCVYAWFNLSRLRGTRLTIWYVIAGTFLILSLGPTLHLWGQVWPVPLPYRLLRLLIPPLKLSGVPVRMVVMLCLAGSVIAACALKLLFSGTRSSRVVAALILLIMVVEYLPAPIPQSSPKVPGYAVELARRPGGGAVLDLASSPAEAMYYQTFHVKPLVFGYVSRIPRSVARKDAALATLISDESYEDLCRSYGIQFIVKPSGELVDLASDRHCSYRQDAIAGLESILETNRVQLPEGSFIKGSGPFLYEFTGGVKHFVDFNVFLRYVKTPDLSKVIVITDKQLGAIPEGQPVTIDDLPEAWRGFGKPLFSWFRDEVRRWTGFHGRLIKL